MKKYSQFEIFRFIGALSVLYYHLGIHSSFSLPKLPFLMEYGIAWVFFFFLLSGFFLTYVYSTKFFDAKVFYKTRFFKFYPVYFLSLLLTLKFRGTIIYNLLLVQSWIFNRSLSYNSSAWYLSVLTFLLLLFPVLLKFRGNKYFVWFVIIINFYVYYFYNYLFQQNSNSGTVLEFIKYNPLMYISTFSLGMLLYDKIKNVKKRNIYSFFTIIYILFLLFIPYNKLIPYNSTVIALFFVPLIVFLYLDNYFFSKFLRNKFFIYLGGLSYSIYVLHRPLYIVFEKFVGEIKNYTDFTIYLFMVFFMANLTKYLIENKLYKYLCEKYI